MQSCDFYRQEILSSSRVVFEEIYEIFESILSVSFTINEVNNIKLCFSHAVRLLTFFFCFNNRDFGYYDIFSIKIRPIEIEEHDFEKFARKMEKLNSHASRKKKQIHTSRHSVFHFRTCIRIISVQN